MLSAKCSGRTPFALPEPVFGSLSFICWQDHYNAGYHGQNLMRL